MTKKIEPVWAAGDLLASLERREKFFVLDVRNRDEFERFQLEGREPLPALNVPYFEMLEMGGQDEMVDSVVACVEQHLTGQIPRDLPVLSVCAKGDTSEYVRQALERLGYTTATPAGGHEGLGRILFHGRCGGNTGAGHLPGVAPGARLPQLRGGKRWQRRW